MLQGHPCALDLAPFDLATKLPHQLRALGQARSAQRVADAGMHTRLMRAYGCGDVCVDQNGCPKCPTTIVADISSGPIPGIEDDSAVVFLSCVLEYVPELQAALQEISRIAGSPENVFIVTVQPWTLSAFLYPGARWRGRVQDDRHIDMKPVALEEKLIATTIVGILCGAAFWPSRKRR